MKLALLTLKDKSDNPLPTALHPDKFLYCQPMPDTKRTAIFFDERHYVIALEPFDEIVKILEEAYNDIGEDDGQP